MIQHIEDDLLKIKFLKKVLTIINIQTEEKVHIDAQRYDMTTMFFTKKKLLTHAPERNVSILFHSVVYKNKHLNRVT